MWILDDIAGLCLKFAGVSNTAAEYCTKIPVLGGALADFFWKGQDFFTDLWRAFARLSDQWEELEVSISDLWTGELFIDVARLTWEWIDDIGGLIWDTALDSVRTTWEWIDDIYGTVAGVVGDVVVDQYSEITDFWGNVAVGVGDWFASDFEDWIENQAERMVNLAGRVLNKVW